MWYQVKEFIRRNRVVLLGAVFVFGILQWCQYRSNQLYRNTDVTYVEKVIPSDSEDLSVKDEENRPAPQTHPLFVYFLLVVMVLLVYVAQRRKWFEKLVPGMVLLRIRIYKSPHKRRMMQIWFMNTSETSQTFDEPVVEFMKYNAVKAFKIKVADEVLSFPITLTRQTAHKIIIDLDQFYDRIPELKSFQWVRVRMKLNGTKNRKTFPKLVKWF